MQGPVVKQEKNGFDDLFSGFVPFGLDRMPVLKIPSKRMYVEDPVEDDEITKK